jgi:prepilin-type N-terminal cleavage/methylation domain-containing protein
MRSDNRSLEKGFTLIELLVVISIIGVLSSIVLASLSSARGKARDTAIKMSLVQYKTLLEITRNDQTGDFDPSLLIGWDNDVTCTVGFTWGRGGLSGQAASICENILRTGGKLNAGIHLGSPNNYGGIYTDYSIMAWLPYKQKYFCLSSSGKSSDTEDGSSWTGAGCYFNI